MQIWIFNYFQRIEKALEHSGLPGRPCLLKAICELRETPIDDKHIAGEMITNFFMWDSLIALLSTNRQKAN